MSPFIPSAITAVLESAWPVIREYLEVDGGNRGASCLALAEALQRLDPIRYECLFLTALNDHELARAGR